MVSANTDVLIETIYQASNKPDQWPRAMELLSGITGSRSAALFIHDKEMKQASGFFPHGISRPVALAYRKLGARNDPGFRRMRDVPVGVSHPIIDLGAPEQEFRAFKELVLRPAGIHAILGINLLNNDTIHAGIGIHRSRQQGSFDAGTRAVVESLAPHFTRAVSIYREFARVSAYKSAYHAGLEHLQIGTVLFDHLARPVYLNPRARFLFENHPATRMREDLPLVVEPEAARELQDAVVGAIEGDIDEVSLGLRHPGARSPLVVRVVSHPEPLEGLSDWQGLARCVMYVADPELSPAVPPRMLQQVYGLTAAESTVAVGLANGLTVNEIADMQHVARSTVRSQLKSVFQKVGVSRQPDLVRIILSLPAPGSKSLPPE